MAIKQGRPPRWEREELILALDLYFEVNPYQINGKDPRVKKLSDILKKLNVPGTKNNLDNFRNPSGVYMKMCNFLRFDPSYDGIGLTRGSVLDKAIWDEFSSNRGLLRKTAIDILNSKAGGLQNNSFDTINHEKNKKMFQEVIEGIKTQ